MRYYKTITDINRLEGNTMSFIFLYSTADISDISHSLQIQKYKNKQLHCHMQVIPLYSKRTHYVGIKLNIIKVSCHLHVNTIQTCDLSSRVELDSGLQRSQFTEMIIPCQIPQLDIPNDGRNHILEFFLVPVRKIISVQEIYSYSLFETHFFLDPEYIIP